MRDQGRLEEIGQGLTRHLMFVADSTRSHKFLCILLQHRPPEPPARKTHCPSHTWMAGEPGGVAPLENLRPNEGPQEHRDDHQGRNWVCLSEQPSPSPLLSRRQLPQGERVVRWIPALWLLPPPPGTAGSKCRPSGSWSQEGYDEVKWNQLKNRAHRACSSLTGCTRHSCSQSRR